MIIERWTWKTKFGCKDEVIKLVKAMVEGLGLTPRVCTFTFGPYHTVFSDLEFESEEDRKQFWDDFDGSQPDFVEWHKRQPELTESDITRELLQVH